MEACWCRGRCVLIWALIESRLGSYEDDQGLHLVDLRARQLSLRRHGDHHSAVHLPGAAADRLQRQTASSECASNHQHHIHTGSAVIAAKSFSENDMKLKQRSAFLAAALVFCCAAGAQNNSAALETVLKKMDTAAANFRTTTADFQWDQFTRVIGATDTQTGKIYFRRNSRNIEMFADVQQGNGKPEPKQVLFNDSKLRLYEHKLDRVTVYDTGKNHADFEILLVL